LTRKDYIAIASIIKRHGFSEQSYFIAELVDYLKRDNPLFDYQKFYEAIK
jgi:hypothetical protein